ncbi:MAG: TonB-dependent receptor [Deltaproteobacteria bacterium]|nr:TonB-dependent receptor [Deltaproteobacteria bacterium]
MAQEEAQIEIHVEEGKEATLDTTSQAEVIIPSQTKTAAQNVVQLLEKAAGVQLKQYGGLDDFAAISIRGSTADQVLIYLDGVLLNTAQGGMTDLSFLPLDRIERIEVYRGGAPGSVTDSTPGGVINITTKKGAPRQARDEKNSLKTSVGSFWTIKNDLGRADSFKHFNHDTAFQYFRSRGDFPYLDDRGTRSNTNDDRIVQRANNDFLSHNFTTTVSSKADKELQWKVYENFFLKNQGVPGLGSSTSATARLDQLRNLFHVMFNNQPSQDLNWEADVFFDFLNSKFQDTRGEIGVGTQDNDDDTIRFGPKFQFSYPFDPNQIITAFVAHRAELFLPTNNTASNPNGPTSQRHMTAIGLEDDISLFNEKLLINPSARLQVFANDLSGTDPSSPSATADNNMVDKQVSAKLGIKYHLTHFFSLKGNVYRGFRQPTFSELFGDRGTLVGNTALQPEKSLNFDTGFRLQEKNLWHFDKISFDAVYFFHSTKNLIQFLQTSQFTAKAQNLNSALIQGGEFSFAAQVLKNFHSNVNYVFQIAKDNQNGSATKGNYLPGRPKHQAYLEASYQFPLIRPFAGLNYLDGNFLDSQNLLKVRHRVLLATGVTLTAHNNLKLNFTAKNLLNERISDLVGYPLPGRSYWSEFEWLF